jgi:osmotically-inducible protein OsmY
MSDRYVWWLYKLEEEVMKMTSTGLPAVLLTTVLSVACQNTARGIEQDAEKNAETAAEVGRDVKASADAATQTVDVKSALMADDTVDASNINVDTSAEAKTVTLKGTVKNAVQKLRAEEIAVAKAPGYRVVNNLVVG